MVVEQELQILANGVGRSLNEQGFNSLFPYYLQ
jgi:hypothetical protein